MIIADAQAAPFAIVQELLEWSPTVIVLEPALHDVTQWGIKLDVVISQQKNVVRHTVQLRDQAPVKILSYAEGEDPVQTAFYFLVAAKYKAVNTLGVEFRKLSPFTDQLDVVAFYAGKRWLYARHSKFEKWLTKGTKIFFPEKITTVNGLDDNGVVVNDGVIKVKSDGPFWMGEEIL